MVLSTQKNSQCSDGRHTGLISTGEPIDGFFSTLPRLSFDNLLELLERIPHV